MPTNFQFWPPANQQDFSNDPQKQQALINQWNTNLNGFIQQGMAGNPWNSTNASGITNYFNPLTTPIPDDAIVTPIQWNAFPGRIAYYFPQLSDTDILSLGDTGRMTSGKSFPDITKDPCTGKPVQNPFGPFGPRGWQDEYCEWAVTRDTSGRITRIDFTCENPEYWNSLWMIDPYKVLQLYQQTLGKSQITLQDLYLKNANGQPVIDPSTGRPAYNPLNIWNAGPFSTSTGGGAMHLTSTPNTLQTEIGLATSATLGRKCGSSDFNNLICCAKYGQPHRNSDPNIGGNTNTLVGAGMTVTLTNPPGLYIQMPDFSQYVTPDKTDASTFWRIERGTATLNDSKGNPLPGNFILHAVFEVPQGKGYTVSDITIGGQKIAWGGQVARTINMHIVATAFTAKAPPLLDCVGSPTTSFAQPLQLFHATVFNAMNGTNIPNPMGQPMTLVSNSTLIAPIAKQGTFIELVLTCDTLNSNFSPQNPTTWPSVTFDSADITAKVVAAKQVSYAVPGNSYPGSYWALTLAVAISKQARTGLRSVFVTNPGQQTSTPMPALLNVIS